MKKTDAVKRIRELRRIIEKYDNAYYVLSQPLISDFEYDNIYRELKELESEYPDLISEDSPTQRVSERPAKGFDKARHKPKMFSLDNTYSDQELADFDRRLANILGFQPEYIIEPKIDGIAVSLIYENGHFTKGISRGDGETGDDITVNMRTVRGLPLNIAHQERLIARGEVFYTRQRFSAIAEEYGFANARNAASGTMKLLDSNEVSRRGLSMRIHTVVTGLADTDTGTLDKLDKLGLPVVEWRETAESLDKIIEIKNTWFDKRHELPYETDGIVIKINNLNQRDKAGFTSKSPRWAFAFKYKPDTAVTKLNSIAFQVGRTGIITPVANLEPVLLAGTTVKRSTLHNFDEIERLDARENDFVEIEKSGEIIPKVIRVLKDKRNGDEKKVNIPVHCPSCGSTLVRIEDQVAVRCVNISCPAQIEGRLIHFTSKNAMNIENMGPALIRQLINEGLLHSFSDIYKLDRESLLKLERMGDKSASNVIDAVQASKHVALNRLIFALGIENVGEYTSSLLANVFGSLEAIQSADTEQLTDIQGIGPEVADSIVKFFANRDNVKELSALMSAGIEPYTETVASALTGLTFVITGTLDKYSRDSAKDMILKNGGKVSSSVSSRTDYLIAGREPGSKFEKAKKNNVKILSEDEFLKMIGE